MISKREFERIVGEGIEAIPWKFRKQIRNVAFIVEDEPSGDVRREQGLSHEETLFGLYTGIPMSERGSEYGVWPTLPDTILIYKKPIEEEACGDPALLRRIVFDTIWHEVGHYIGLDDPEIERLEEERGIGHYHPGG